MMKTTTHGTKVFPKRICYRLRRPVLSIAIGLALSAAGVLAVIPSRALAREVKFDARTFCGVYAHTEDAAKRNSLAVPEIPETQVLENRMDAQKYWVAQSGLWSNASNWDPPGQPADGDHAYLLFNDSNTRIITYANALSPTPMLNSLTVSNSGPAKTTLFIPRDTLDVVNEFIGSENGTSGWVFQANGTHVIGDELFLGYIDGSFGSYLLKGGILSVGSISIGGRSQAEAAGIFFQEGGTNQSAGILIGQGYGNDSYGVYELDKGSLEADYVSVGEWGNGYFNQRGGTFSGGNLVVGYDGPGRYVFSGGRFEVDNIALGIGTGAAIFEQIGRSIRVRGELIIAAQSASPCRYVLVNGKLDVQELQIFEMGVYDQLGGKLVVQGDVENSGMIRTAKSRTRFNGVLTNDAAFVSQFSKHYFNDLVIGDSGSMSSASREKWFVRGSLTGLKFEGDTVTNIRGPRGMRVYYNPADPDNAYLGGRIYPLAGGGRLQPR